MNSDTAKAWAQLAFAVLTIAAFIGMLFMLFLRAIPDANKSAFDIALGLVGTLVATMVNYLFGSSLGSAAKDRTISAALVAASPPVVPSTTTTTTTVQPQGTP